MCAYTCAYDMCVLLRVSVCVCVCMERDHDMLLLLLWAGSLQHACDRSLHAPSTFTLLASPSSIPSLTKQVPHHAHSTATPAGPRAADA